MATPADGAALWSSGGGRWAPGSTATWPASARGRGDGLVAPRALVDSVVDELDDLLALPDDAWPLAAPARAEHADWPPRDRAAFARRAARRRSATRSGPRSRDSGRSSSTRCARMRAPDDRAGLAHVPGGDEAYRQLVRAHTTLDLEPEAIHATGLEEVARIDAEFAELGARPARHGRDGARRCARLRDDPALHFATRDEVRATAEAALRRATAAIGGWFGRLPVAACEVVVMGDHEAKHSTIAYYREPAADGSRPGRYYINTYAPETRPRYEAEVLAFHEAVPGHHLQLAIAQELTELPAFRRFGGPTAYVEGWGLYTERLCEEMGLYSGRLDRFGVLSFDAWRACRLVVDTGLHALGWTRQQAIDFMVEHTALAENNIVNEVDRYIAMPGQALAYKLGQLELLRLRARGRGRRSAPASTSGRSTTPSCRRARSAWRRCAASSRTGSRPPTPGAAARLTQWPVRGLQVADPLGQRMQHAVLDGPCFSTSADGLVAEQQRQRRGRQQHRHVLLYFFDILENGISSRLPRPRSSSLRRQAAPSSSRGYFTISGGVVTGGTTTGYNVFAGDNTKVIKASGFDVSATDLINAINQWQMFNDYLLQQVLLDLPTKFIGSELGDFTKSVYGSGSVFLGRKGDDELFAPGRRHHPEGRQGQRPASWRAEGLCWYSGGPGY